MADAPLILGDADFRRQIKNSPAAGYLLFGEEDYLKAAAVTLARRTIIPDPTFAPFNEILLDALSYTPDDLRRAFTAVPMMADRKLILLRGLDFTSMRPSEFDALCRALDELSDTDDTTLLIPVAAGAIDEGYLPKRPSAQLSRLCANLTPVRFTKCTPEKLRFWCARHFEHNGAAATPAVCDELIRTCGRSMFTLASEIDKVSYYALAHGRTDITKEDIAAAASPVAEYDAFAFANAVMEQNAPAALAILSDLKFRRVEPLYLLSEVIRVLCDMLSVLLLSRDGVPAAGIASALKLHEFKVRLYLQNTAVGEARLRAALDAANRADRVMKLSPAGYSALEDVICSL